MTRLPNKPSQRPQLIKLPHPYLTASENSRVCVFVKDPQRAFKDEIANLDIPTIAKVIGYDKLKRNYKQFKDRRSLLKEYDSFLADLRVYKMLPEVLGKEFYTQKKFPVPLKLHGFASGKELESQLNDAAGSSQFMQGNGPNYSVTVGRTNQKPTDVALNAQDALWQAVAHLTCFESDRLGLENISQVTLKIDRSPELPILNQLESEDIEAFNQA